MYFFEKIWDFKTIPTLNSGELIDLPDFFRCHQSSSTPSPSVLPMADVRIGFYPLDIFDPKKAE